MPWALSLRAWRQNWAIDSSTDRFMVMQPWAGTVSRAWEPDERRLWVCDDYCPPMQTLRRAAGRAKRMFISSSTRTYRLPVPAPPPGTTLARKPPSSITMKAGRGMYVPKRLGAVGFAGYEPTALPHLLAMLAGAGDGAFFDVGLNVGPYALLAKCFSERTVVGFEPTPALAEVARACAQRNGLDYRVEQIALGDENGTATLYLSDVTDSSNSLNSTFRPNSVELQVPLETLDAYVARTGIVPAAMKVDTETFEPQVLAGAVQTVGDHRPWIMVEVLAGRVEDRMMEVIRDWDYCWYFLDGPGPLTPVDTIVGDPTHTNLMFLLTPQPLDDDYWSCAQAWTTAFQTAEVTTSP